MSQKKKESGKRHFFLLNLLTRLFLFVRNQVQNPYKGNRLVDADTILFLPNNGFVGIKKKIKKNMLN